jgi:HSP20 family molecular chaperone IbpA
MATNKMQLPQELLAQFDLMNTVGGGMAPATVNAWQANEGYHLVLQAPGVDPETVHIEAADKRFVMYRHVDVLGGAQQRPFYFVNLPLSPLVDVARITARIEHGAIHVFAPFNDWAKGTRKQIGLES